MSPGLVPTDAFCPYCHIPVPPEAFSVEEHADWDECPFCTCGACGSRFCWVEDGRLSDGDGADPIAHWISGEGNNTIHIASDEELDGLRELLGPDGVDVVASVELFNWDGTLPCFIHEDGRIEYRFPDFAGSDSEDGCDEDDCGDEEPVSFRDYIAEENDEDALPAVDTILRDLYRIRIGREAPVVEDGEEGSE